MIRKPVSWEYYEDPYDNLLFGILMQCLADTEGYTDNDNKTYCTGEDAKEFLQTTGKEIYIYLSTRKRIKDGLHEGWNRIPVRSHKTGKIIGRR